jgi:multidrug efflux pump subunit AcrA (membrane-fusion protein)
MPVRVEFRELPGHPYEASVARFAHSLDLATRTMLTEIDIENSRREIYPGMYANATLELERHHGALELPNSAVAEAAGGGHFVLVARGGRLEEIPVTVGINTGIYMEITSGLSGNEEVVRSLTAALSNGEPVRTVLDEHYHLGFHPELAKANHN